MTTEEARAARPRVPPVIYQPLYDWQTRLIKLSPLTRKNKTVVTCSLHTVDLVSVEGVVLTSTKELVTYEALSYSWGREPPNRTIRCNEEKCIVSEQLEEALWSLCYVDKSRWVWCDAFCINQNDCHEKSKQVQKIQIIFGKAEQVIVWLGPVDVTSRISDALAKWAKYDQQGNKSRRQSLAHRRAVVRELSKVEWLKRTWIRQEIQAARRIVISSAHPEVLTWENLTKISEEAFGDMVPEPNKRMGIEYYQTPVLSKEFLQNPLTLLYYINSPRRYPFILRNAQHHRLAEWIVSMTLFQTSIPADKVFGILGLFEPSSRGGHSDDICSLKVNYEEPLNTVYTEMMKRILVQSRNLAWLEAHVFDPEAKNKENLPSWVFDWESDWKSPSFDIVITRQSQAQWAASSSHVANQVRLLEIQPDWADFNVISDSELDYGHFTWSVEGNCYTEIEKVYPSDHEDRERSYLPPEIFDLGLWRMATYKPPTRGKPRAALEDCRLCRHFYVVSWARPGDIIVRFGTCPNFFILRPIDVGAKVCFQYLGRAIARVSPQRANQWRFGFQEIYRSRSQKFILI